MAVRYRKRGFDARPGRRISYVFQNEITKAKGIPPKTSYGVIRSVYNGMASVRFDGNDFDSSVPPIYLAPEDAPGECDGGDFGEWLRNHPARPKNTGFDWDRWRETERQDPRTGVRTDLTKRAEARFGPFIYWKRPTDDWYRRNGIKRHA
jgi:hypothetical protein